MDFKTFFGVEEKEVKHNCIVCQKYDLSMFSDKPFNGLFVKSANITNATIIALKNNFLVGDTILQLKNTVCENVFLFGGCGGCEDRNYGDVVIIDKAYNLESFSNMLNFKGKAEYYQSTRLLLNDFTAKSGINSLIKTNSACVSSLALEANFLSWFKENGISVADMESSIVFSAAKSIDKNVICLMYITDLIKEGFTTNISESYKQKISDSRKKLAESLLKFCENL